MHLKFTFTHGVVEKRRHQTDIELALRHWARLRRRDASRRTQRPSGQPGIVFDRRRARSTSAGPDTSGATSSIRSKALRIAVPYSEEAAAVEVSYYQEDGQDEHSWVRRPTPESIRDMQRRRMIDDLSALLARHFGDAENRAR